MSNNILSLIGLAKKAGKLEIGEEPVSAAARAGQARLICIASDAADNSQRRAGHFAEASHVVCIDLPFTKAELGFALGRTSCAMLALTDAGFSASIVKKLSLNHPDQYSEAAQLLDEKAQKVLQRQKEQRVHERRVRENKAKPWTPKPKQEAKAPPSAAPKPRVRPGGSIQIKGKLPMAPKKP